MAFRKILTLVLTIILLGGLLAAETLHNTGNTSATIIPEIDYTVEQAQRLLAVDAVTAATSSEDGGSNYRLHRILGYLTMGGVVASGLLGWLTPGDLHAGVGIGTTGLATVTSGLAILDFARGGSLPLPHVILTGLGTVGFAANLFIEPGEEEGSEGSNLHSILGAASVGAFALGVSWVIAY